MDVFEKLKITKGPWRLKKGYHYIIESNEGYIARDICRLDSSTMSAFYQKGNAQLVTAAPDIIIALIETCLHWEENRYFPNFIYQNNISAIEKSFDMKWNDIKIIYRK